MADNDQRETTTELASQTAMKVEQGTAQKASIEKRDDQIVWDIRIDKAAFSVDSRTAALIKTVEKRDSN